MTLQIEHLLFQQIEKPDNYLMTKVIEVFDNHYRINVYIQIEEDGLLKRKIRPSVFAKLEGKDKLRIIPDPERKSLEK